MSEQKQKFDIVKILGILVAIGLFVGSLQYSKRASEEHNKALEEWQKKYGTKPETVEKAEGPNKDAATPGETRVGKRDESAMGPAGQQDTVRQPNDTSEHPGDKKPVPSVEPVKATPPVEIKGKYLECQMISKGAVLKTAWLADEKPTTRAKTSGLQILDEIEIGQGSLAMPYFRFGETRFSGENSLDETIWNLEENSPGFDGENGAQTVSYNVQLSAEGVAVCKVTKIFRMKQDGRHLDLDIVVSNLTDKSQEYEYALRGPAGILLDGPADDPEQGAYVLIKCTLAGRAAGEDEPDMIFVYPDDTKKPDEIDRRMSKGENLWACVQNRFFMATLISKDPSLVSRMLVEPLNTTSAQRRTDKSDDKRYQRHNLTPVMYRRPLTQAERTALAAGESSDPDHFALYLGPSQQILLEQYEKESLGLSKSIHLAEGVQFVDIGSDWWNWSWPRINWLAGILLSLFRAIESAIGSFGIAVVVLTFIVKLTLHPLQRKMNISMHKMQQIQPKLKAIELKYEGQTKPEVRQKKEMEKLDLMRKEGANPAMGCLPMFVQLPIFFALYGTFRFAFEIRQAKFLWIEDLSLADRLYEFSFWPHQLNLLPLIYMAMTFIQMRMQPTPASPDPQQEMNRKIMQFMPVLFGFMFYHMPSGLVLYFAISACFGFIESWYIKRFVLKVDASGKPLPGSEADGKNSKVTSPVKPATN